MQCMEFYCCRPNTPRGMHGGRFKLNILIMRARVLGQGFRDGTSLTHVFPRSCKRVHDEDDEHA
jgi:hypothetical protein